MTAEIRRKEWKRRGAYQFCIPFSWAIEPNLPAKIKKDLDDLMASLTKDSGET